MLTCVTSLATASNLTSQYMPTSHYPLLVTLLQEYGGLGGLQRLCMGLHTVISFIARVVSTNVDI
jgi:hypothetical protein